jgi:hypothetical protein
MDFPLYPNDDGSNPELETRLAKWKPAFDDETGAWVSGGLAFDDVTSEVELALLIFRWAHTPEQREYAFWEFARLVWLKGDISLQKNLFEWHPWAAQQVKDYCEYRFIAVGGSSNSGKSRTLAAFSIASWVCDPAETLVLLTSTSIRDSMKRVFKSIDELLSPLIKAKLAPTKIRADGSAPYNKPDGTIFNGAGIFVIAGAVGKERDADSRLIGIKASSELQTLPDGSIVSRPRLIIGADELSELSPAILSGLRNLRSQQPLFAGLSNPSSPLTPFGEFSEPADGWGSVNLLEDDSWPTKSGGLYRRYDGTKSPNILAGETIYTFLPTEESIQEARDQYGENSIAFLRFIRASFYTAGASDGCFSLAELRQGEAIDPRKIDWIEGTTKRIAGMDPSQTNLGDGCTLQFATVGIRKDGAPHIEFDPEIRYLHSDDTNAVVPRTYQIVQQVKELCAKEKVTPDRFVVDNTMGSWGDVLVAEWGHGIYMVDSNYRATDRPLQGGNAEAAPGLVNSDRFIDRASEMWLSPRVLLRNKQISGLHPKAVEQITTRGFAYGRGGKGNGVRVSVEPKKIYRQRVGGSSPDEADTAFLLIDLAIERHGLLPTQPREERNQNSHGLNWWLGLVGAGRDPSDLRAYDFAGRNDEAFL